MNDTVLQVQGLRKNYPAFTLSEVSFSLEAGRIMGFIGRNGAGKTTTLKSILGLVHPDAGEIRYFGLPFAQNEQRIKEQIGYAAGGTSYYQRRRVGEIARMTASFYPGWDDAAYRNYLRRFSLDESKCLREAAVYTKNAMMNANFAYLGWLLILFALFNSVFLGGFLRTAYGLGKPFILYSIAGFAVICLAEALHHFPGMAAMNSQTEGFGMQLIVLAAGVLLFVGMTALSCRKAQKNFERIDL